MNPDSSDRSSIITKWQSWGPEFLAILRIVVALLFISIGMMKLFGWPLSMPGGGTVQLFSLIGLAGVLETFGGLLILLGLFTRPVAFILAGEMAFAYFMGHSSLAHWWPVVNNGQPAVLYCFIFLYMSAVGAGAWSLDRLWRKKN